MNKNRMFNNIYVKDVHGVCIYSYVFRVCLNNNAMHLCVLN